MSRTFLEGLAVGVGIGWLNATALGLPGWANIVLMVSLLLLGMVEADLSSRTTGRSDY